MSSSLGTNISEILIKIQNILFLKMHLNVVCEMMHILSRPQCVNTKATNGFGCSL